MNPNSIRNFSIIAHIDHGKTTLTDRLLLKTNTTSQRDFRDRMLDTNPIEQERGITIKLAPVRMKHLFKGKTYVLNLIDTPGHVDFSYEVSRSLAACEGAILLVDATQGIQAQTISNFQKAKDQKLRIIPVLNKIDLLNADPETVKLDLIESLQFSETEILSISAKTGQNIDQLLDSIITKLPPPKGVPTGDLQALVFNSLYHSHKGVIIFVRVVNGKLTKENLHLLGTNTNFEPQEIGIFSPMMTPIDSLSAGEVGFIATGLKDISLAQVGDTVTKSSSSKVNSLPGYKPPQLMVYMDFYPIDGKDFNLLLDALEKLKLNDAALKYSSTHSKALGNGFRVGFLGVFHAEIVQERLAREFDLNIIATAPSVKYKLKLTDGKETSIKSPSQLPDPSSIQLIKEPIVLISIFTPKQYLGAILQLCDDHRGKLENMDYFGDRIKLNYRLPLAEMIINFYDELKSVSSGFASIEYQISDYQPIDAVKLTILVNKEPVEALSQIVVREKAEEVGRFITKRLKEVIPRQLFEIPIQAAIGGKIIARETVKAFRKDVTAKLYGGDITRRKKLLEKQKKGKSKRKAFGKVELPQEAFLAVLKR